jgi:hypothetical protein
MTSHRRWTPGAASLITLALVLAACGTDSGGSSGSSSAVQVWEGYTQTEAKVFAQGPGWTWQDFQAAARKLTDPAHKQYGTAYVTPGTEDTVWHWEALLWEAGGQLLTPDNSKAAFDSPAGLMSLNTPSYPGASGGHQTISGPDNWVIFNNGGARVAAAEKFLLWLTAPAQDKYFALKTGDLPIRRSFRTCSGSPIIPTPGTARRSAGSSSTAPWSRSPP